VLETKCNYSLKELTGYKFRLNAGDQIKVRCRAKNSEGWSLDWSEPKAEGTCTDDTVLERACKADRPKVKSQDEDKITVTWKPCHDDADAANMEYTLRWDKCEDAGMADKSDWTKLGTKKGTEKDDFKFDADISGKKRGTCHFYVETKFTDDTSCDPVLSKHNDVRISSKPDAMSCHRATVKDCRLRIDWDEPLDNGGKPITSYKIEVKTKSGDWIELDEEQCNPRLRKFNMYCLVGARTLKEEPFEFEKDDEIETRITPRNANGEGETSDEVCGGDNPTMPGLPD